MTSFIGSQSYPKVSLDGVEIVVPKVIGRGASEGFGCMPYFAKPKWIADDLCSTCNGCQQKFTQIRRKHHCRNCGAIFCSTCCNFKVPLPQFGLDEPQRVCSICHDVASLIAKARSPYVAHWQEAASGLSQMTKNVKGLIKFLSCGGAQTLIALGAQGDDAIKTDVSSGMYELCQHVTLHPILVDMGIIKLIKHILKCSNVKNEAATSDAMASLILLAKSDEFRHKTLEEGILEALTPLLPKWSSTSLLAARVVCHLAENPDTHGVLQNSLSLVPNLMEALNSEDKQMRETVLKIFGCLSAGSEIFRHRLILEDTNLEQKLLAFVQDTQVSHRTLLCHVVCLIGNLATSAPDQIPLQPYLGAVCDLLYVTSPALDSTVEGDILLVQIARTLANFSEFNANHPHIVRHLPMVVSVLLQCNVEHAKLHTCRLIANLLANEPAATLETIVRNGVGTFLEILFNTAGVRDVVCNSVLRKVSRLSMPR